jgi:gas vesicle protein
MALTEEYTSGRLDRLAGDIRDEVAGRREGNSELREELREAGTELRKEIAQVRAEASKNIHRLWLAFIIAAGVALTVSLALIEKSADDSEAGVRPISHHRATPASSSMETQPSQHSTALNKDVREPSDRVAETVQQLRSRMNSGFEEVKAETKDRDKKVFDFAMAMMIALFFIATAIMP